MLCNTKNNHLTLFYYVGESERENNKPMGWFTDSLLYCIKGTTGINFLRTFTSVLNLHFTPFDWTIFTDL